LSVSCQLLFQEGDDRSMRRCRVIDERPMPAVGQDDHLGAREARPLTLGLLDGNPEIVSTPQDQCGYVELAHWERAVGSRSE